MAISKWNLRGIQKTYVNDGETKKQEFNIWGTTMYLTLDIQSINMSERFECSEELKQYASLSLDVTPGHLE